MPYAGLEAVQLITVLKRQSDVSIPETPHGVVFSFAAL
jgi:hypothetical protein